MPRPGAITLSPGDGRLRATFAPDAGMVCCSLRDRGEELLDQGRGVDAYAEQGATMGIPLLHPWANRLAAFEYSAAGRRVQLPPGPPLLNVEEHGLPIHGVIPGQLRWRVLGTDTDGAEQRLRAGLDWNEPRLLAVFPFPHRLEWEASLGRDALTITTTLLATANAAVPVSFGYHPYVTLPGAARDGWRVQMPAMRQLALDELSIPTGASVPFAPQQFALASSSWDDGFGGLAQPARFAVTGGGRHLSVELIEGYPYAQVFAPPGKPFICFEPMTAPANALISGDGLALVDPGGSYRAVFRIAVSPDAGAEDPPEAA